MDLSSTVSRALTTVGADPARPVDSLRAVLIRGGHFPGATRAAANLLLHHLSSGDDARAEFAARIITETPSMIVRGAA